jgi:hypothetical protein
VPLCPSGTFVDQLVASGRSPLGVGASAITVRRTWTCSDGSTFMTLFHPQVHPSTPSGCTEAGPFSVVGGTNEFSSLSGAGDFCVDIDFASNTGTETFTGTFLLS